MKNHLLKFDALVVWSSSIVDLSQSINIFQFTLVYDIMFIFT